MTFSIAFSLELDSLYSFYIMVFASCQSSVFSSGEIIITRQQMSLLLFKIALLVAFSILDCVEKVRVGMLEYMHRNSESKETEFYAKQQLKVHHGDAGTDSGLYHREPQIRNQHGEGNGN